MLTLKDALRRARDYSQQFIQAGTAAALAREDRVQAKAAFFPSAGAFDQYIYTQGNGTPSGVFVANDGVHVYNEQATVHAEVFSLSRWADYQRAVAAEAAAGARRDIAARGLVATVVQNYYALVTAQRHEVNAVSSLHEARQFLDITQKQEQGGEVARADVVKAELQYQQRQRDLTDARTNTQKARIALGVMLFPNLTQSFDITDDLRPDLPLPPLEEVRSLALSNSPEVREAEAGLRQSEAGIRSARSAYYPTLMLDYFFGLDANVLAFRGPENRQNLGSAIQGTVNIPIWNWGLTRSKVRQAEASRKQAEFDLTFAHRMLETNLRTFYLEAQSAQAQLDSLHRSADLAEESLRLTVLRYEAGEATALEVVDAQITLAQARNASADGLARFRVALAALQTLTGQL
jgi:outer membrane protein TolC